jgi:predicted NUDIX family NTP pyrophosphohydrolase
MPKLSAGLVVYKKSDQGLRLLLVHPGGPFWRNKDEGAWSIPKGEYGGGDDALDAARREFEEELGVAAPAGPYTPLGEVSQRGGKIVTGFAVEGDFDLASFKSNLCELEWPPRSGRRASFPEVDRAEWFSPEEAARKIIAAQRIFLDRLANLLAL